MSGLQKSWFNYFIVQRKGTFSHLGRMLRYLPLQSVKRLPGLQAVLSYYVRRSGACAGPFPSPPPHPCLAGLGVHKAPPHFQVKAGKGQEQQYSMAWDLFPCPAALLKALTLKTLPKKTTLTGPWHASGSLSALTRTLSSASWASCPSLPVPRCPWPHKTA